jgi:DNA-binding protein HU-beta
MMLVKKDLVQTIAALTGLSQRDITLVLETNAQVVLSSLKKGDEATVVGLGKIGTMLRSGRTGRNPKTGAPVEVMPSIAIKFKPASTLKAALN